MSALKSVPAAIKSALVLALFAISLPASAVLYCYDSNLGATQWTVGNKYLGAGSVPDYCWASGAELAYIRSHFTGLRMRINSSAEAGYGYDVVTWFGDDATFIVNNL